MSEQNYATAEQTAELMKYISDNIAIPVLGAGGGFAPIGTINFFDASIAPQGWLACDGSTYNIADYPELATYYASVHGSSNFYGGNGTTTFAVPDLRGEFIRGAGTNSHANQGDGANIGVHQDGTLHYDNIMYDYNGTHYIGFKSGRTNQLSSDNKDFYTEAIGKSYGSLGTATNSDVIRDYTSRPTNTSFLICVKATVAGDPNGHVYSTEEQIVGTDENGNYVYEKTFRFTNIVCNETTVTLANLSSLNIDELQKIEGIVREGTVVDNACCYNVRTFYDGNTSALKIQTTARWTFNLIRLVLQYTKTS